MMTFSALDWDLEPPDQVAKGANPQTIMEKWALRLPALSPTYENKLYNRQRRVNPEIDPGPYSWVRLRHVAAWLLGVIAFNLVLNFSLNHIFLWIHRSFELGRVQQEHVAEAFQKAMALVRYEVIMGRSPGLTQEQQLLHVQAVMAAFEAQERQRMVAVIAHRVSDLLCAAGAAAFLLVQRANLRCLWAQLRLLLRLNFRTPFRAVVLLFVSDVMLGFHSNELWVLLLTALGDRYGIPIRSNHWINIIKAIIPVAFDVWFKFVIFYYMQTKTKVIMREMSEY